MSDSVAKLTAELQILDGRIQAERNGEVRHALQRGRLEAERGQLLVKLMEAVTHRPEAATPPPSVSPPWRVTVHGTAAPSPVASLAATPNLDKLVSTAKDARRKHKPDGLPSIADMITAAFQETPGARAPEVADYIRKRWGWPELKTPVISTMMWRMAKSGHLTQHNGQYGLNGVGH